MPPSLEERWTNALDKLANSFVQQTELLRSMADVQKQLNDGFILHQAEATHMAEKLNEMDKSLRETYTMLFKWFALALIAIAAGTEVAQLLV